MPKNLAVIFVCMGLLVVLGWGIYLRNTPSTFFCESGFSIAQKINSESVLADGLITLEASGNRIFINIDGLMTRNEKKYIISRNLQIEYQTHSNHSHYYRIKNIKLSRYNADNIDDDFVSDLLFSTQGDTQLLFMQKTKSNMLIFGSNLFPKYGCRKK